MVPTMSYESRTIAFQAEILFPPTALRADLVQGIHNTLYRQPLVAYQNFQVAHDGIHLVNLPAQPGQVSAATFLPDRIVLREELRGISVEDFAARTVNVASLGFQQLGIGSSAAQQFVVRALIAPKHHRDGREFVSRRLLAGGSEAWSAFESSPLSLGIRLSFPPREPGREMYHVRIETWPQDPRSVWIEVQGVFPAATAAEHLPGLADQLYATYRFLNGPVADFVSRHDTP
ncbi:MAG: hypothetical protein RL148_94 [Planctomycetota bacterium]|jgi:hypothetical protein